jgi:excisionase family DNA binding protein
MTIKKGLLMKIHEPFVRIDEVANHLGSSASLVRKKTHDPSNPIPHHRMPGGRAIRFRLTEIDAWIEGNTGVSA